MDQLNKLIKQYERENPGQKAKDSYYCLSTDKDIEFYTDDFVLWLASRPTCGQEQRLFLDEVEKMEYMGNGLVKDSTYYLAVIEDQFEADLSKVIKGE
jgi:hypothetical protein